MVDLSKALYFISFCLKQELWRSGLRLKKTSHLLLMTSIITILYAKICHSTHLAYTLLDKMVDVLFGKPASGQAKKE